MRRRLSGALLAGLLLIGTGLGLLAYRYLRGGARPMPQAAQQPSPTVAPKEEVSIRRPVIKHTEGGRVAWQVRLKELKITAGAEAVAAAGMQDAIIFDKTGLPAIRVTAREARGNTAARNLEVSGNVRAASQKGAVISTELVQWREQERRLVCPGLVTVRTRSAAMAARGLSYYADTGIVKVPGLVRIYSGTNKLIGRQLVYDVRTEAFQMKKVQAIFNPQEVRQLGPPR